jgi:hypothetical protein
MADVSNQGCAEDGDADAVDPFGTFSPSPAPRPERGAEATR